MCNRARCWIDRLVSVVFRAILYTLPKLIAQTLESSELGSVELSIGGPWVEFYATRLVGSAYEVVTNRHAYQISREIFDFLWNEVAEAGIWCQETREPSEGAEAVLTVTIAISESLKANR